MITKETFKKLVLALVAHGSNETRLIDGIKYKAYRISEITLILVQFKDKWTPEGISFELFGDSFFIEPNGTISITNEINTYDEVYELQDYELMAVVASFLKWRLSVITQLKV